MVCMTLRSAPVVLVLEKEMVLQSLCHCRRQVQNSDCPCAMSDRIKHIEVVSLAQDLQKYLTDVREAPLSLRLASSHFGFTDFKATISGN